MRNKVYLDVCALCRPYDDQAFLRIQMETNAVQLILTAVKNGEFDFVISPVHRAELNATVDTIEWHEINALLKLYGTNIHPTRAARDRAEELFAAGFGLADAAHVAYAESYSCDFVSCDDNLIRKCRAHVTRIWTGNPVEFCQKEDLK